MMKHTIWGARSLDLRQTSSTWFRWAACFAVALSGFAFLPEAEARTQLKIHTTRTTPAVGQSTDIFLQVSPLDSNARITIQVLEPGNRTWTMLTRNAERSGGIPRVTWHPRHEGAHTIRVDYVAPGQREIRKTQRINVERDAVRLDISGGVPAVGSSVILTADYEGRGHRSLAFAVKYDDENRWLPINGARDGKTIRWFPYRDGGAELRVRATPSSGRTIEGFSRVLVRPRPEPVRMTGESPLNRKFPAFKHLVTIAETRAYAGERRKIMVNLWGEPRRDRKIRIRLRHETRDNAWVVHRENADRLNTRWTPWHPGTYRIEVELTEANGDLVRREEIEFIALDPRR